MPKSTEFIRMVLQNLKTSKGFDHCLKNFHLVSAGDGKCKMQFTVADEHLNPGGTLHGGFTSTVVDCVSTYALMTYKTGAAGLSVDLHVTFLKGAFPGDVVTVDAKTLRAGKTLAFLTVELTKNDGMDIIACGQHTKYVG